MQTAQKNDISAKNRIMVFILMAAGFFGSLSQNLLSSALPAIMAEFQVGAAVAQWLTTSCLLVMGIITAISAYLFYRFNTKRLLQVSVIIFIIGCVLACFAPSFPVLLTARLLQAVGAGPLIPLLQIALLYIYPKEHQGAAIGLSGIIVGFAPAVGPTLSGVMVDAFGWRSIFVMLIILYSVVLLLSQLFMDNIGERQVQKLDRKALTLYAVGFSAFMLAVTFLKSGGFIQLRVLLLFVSGIVCLYVFVRRQLRSEAPILKLSLFRYRSLTFGTVILSAAYVMNMAGTILVPLYNQTVNSFSATVSGLILLPGSLIIALFSRTSGRLMDRFGARATCIFGMLCQVIGNACFLFFTETTPIAPIIIAYALRCTGMTFLMTPSTALAVQDMPLIEKPHGMAILNSLRQMSGSLFSSVLVVIAAIVSSPASLNMHGCRVACACMTAIAAICLPVTLCVPVVKPKRG